MKLYDRYGAEMMHVKSLERNGEDLMMKGKMMGHIPANVYLKPEELWKSLKLLSWSMIWYMPFMLFKGWRRSSGKMGAEGKGGEA